MLSDTRAIYMVGALCVAVMTAGCSGSSNPDPLPNMQVVKSTRGSAGEESTTKEAAVSTGEGWGTLKGRFVLNGTAPSLPNLRVTKDIEVCGKMPIPDEMLVVGPEGGIANVVVFVGKANRVNPDSLSARESKPAFFDQHGCRFVTHVLPVLVGETITLQNSDPVPHNVNIAPTGDKQFNQIIATGGEVEYAFGRRQSSPFPVVCNIHPWMKGYMFPRDDAYVAVSAGDGTFEIANLPAGEEIEMRVWHEAATGGLEAKSDWKKGRFTVTIEADGTKDLGTIEVPLSAFSL